MGLLSGSISVSRYAVLRAPEPDFDDLAFREIAPGSEVRESIGFVPYELGAPYQIGAGKYAFRVRIDRLRPDPTQVKERLQQLVQAELEMSGRPFVGPKKRKELRYAAEDELLARAAPRTRILEGFLDGSELYIGSTARTVLGTVLLLLRRLGIETAPKAPWIDLGLPEMASELVEIKDQGDSAYGCKFLASLVGDRELLIEPEAGRIKLATHEAKVTLAGEVLPELLRYLERPAEVLAMKLVLDELTFALDGASFRLSGVRVPRGEGGHWTERLLERVERVSELYARLDKRFEELLPGFGS